MRKVLGAKAEDLQAHSSAWNDDEVGPPEKALLVVIDMAFQYMPLKLTSSWIGERTILCFFHAAVGMS